MILGTRCLAENSLNGPFIVEALASTGLNKVLIEAHKGASAAELHEVPAMGVQSLWADRGEAVAAAKASGAQRLVLDLPEEVELDAACRSMFAFARQVSGLALAVQTPASGSLAEPEVMGLLLEDLTNLSLGYWHRPSRAFLLEQADTLWVDRLSSFLGGVLLDDVSLGEAGLPPGLGELDFGSMAQWTTRGLDLVLDVDPLPEPSLLKPAVDSLLRLGFS